MDACFSSVGWSRCKQKSVTVEHHYRVDIFTVIIDQQLQELNNRFNEQAIKLLKLSTTLDPRNNYKLIIQCWRYMLTCWQVLSSRFFWPRKNSFETSVAALWVWCTQSSKIKEHVIDCWFMLRIGWNIKIKNLSTSWQVDSVYFDSSCFDNNYWTSFLSDEDC
jgi:hypothetical protein